MNTSRRRSSKHAFLGAALTAAVVLGACHHQAPPPPLPPLPAQQLSAPSTTTSIAPATVADTAREAHVDVDTHNTDADVRPLLDFVARAGGFNLVYPQSLNRKVRVQLVNVPVSVALQALLSAASLEIETTTPGAKLPGRSSVVFYELPTNVDSLSADAIVKRYGISPTLAELIVRGRAKP